MEHYVYKVNKNNEYPIAILIKESAFNKNLVKQHYVTPLINQGIKEEDIILIGVKYNDQNKAPVKLIKEELSKVLSNLQQVKTTTILCADSAYFKTLTKLTKSEQHHGYIKPGVFGKDQYYSSMDIILSINYQALFHNPTIIDRLEMSISTLAANWTGTHKDIGCDIIHSAEYFSEDEYGITEALLKLHQYPELTCDIEAFSLELDKAGIGTIAFAWDKHNGIAFTVDYLSEGSDIHMEPYVTADGGYARQVVNPVVRDLLRQFFKTYKGKLIYHGGTYDIKMLIYALFMKDALDIEGLIFGLKLMYRDIDDTLIITYLATNTCSGNKLNLKYVAFEFAGNYAQEDIKDITRIPEDKLLKYNLTDALATWFVKEKNEPIMIADNQQQIHDKIFIPSMKVITHMELIGMPMSKDEILNTDHALNGILNYYESILKQSPLIKEFEWQQAREAMITKNLLLKRKVKPIEDFRTPFNPASNNQVRRLVYEVMKFPVQHKTDTGQASTSNKALKGILNRLKNKYNISEEELK